MNKSWWFDLQGKFFLNLSHSLISHPLIEHRCFSTYEWTVYQCLKNSQVNYLEFRMQQYFFIGTHKRIFSFTVKWKVLWKKTTVVYSSVFTLYLLFQLQRSMIQTSTSIRCFNKCLSVHYMVKMQSSFLDSWPWTRHYSKGFISIISFNLHNARGWYYNHSH